MSAAPSLYRRHRPRSFADVVGQEHVVRTLRNAVEQGKVHHAYLFVGSRGTGKTSMAKILAACLNCQNGPTVEPDGSCDSCRAIANATSLDVIEMDAASNNSVDDIRDLRERVAFAPVSGKHKVYILDEAHMLTPAAWNAFLKTLEEPPPNTVFVLATTEANKILPTVADRCHRFDFTRPTVEQIATVLRRVAADEGIEIGPDALAVVARHATGSFRDALGTLEQLVTYSGRTIALDDVLAVLGVADADLLYESLDAIAASDARRALLAAGRLTESGRDATAFLRDLEAHARDLLIVGTLGEVPAELAMTADRDVRLTEQAERVPRGDVVRLLELIAAAIEAIKAGAEARTQLELALVKAAAPKVDASTKALLARIERLERALAGAAPPSGVANGGAREGANGVPPDAPAGGAAGSGSGAGGGATHGPSTGGPARSDAAAPGGGARGEAGAPGGGARGEADAPGGSARGEAAAPGGAARSGADAPGGGAPSEAPAPGDGARSEAPAAGGGGHSEVNLAALRDLWPAVLDTVRTQNGLLAAVLADARPCDVRDGQLVIAFTPDKSFLRRKAEDATNRQLVAEAVRSLAGRSLGIAYELREAEEECAPGAPALTDDELVERIKAEFEAEEIVPDETEEPA
ncbi:MAG TPA: DNA polymerase III subunit gamma/tau [Solirubrobacteraceae bacterium]|nr:DNA polymerase III subunit gamma/tau [Solirubrobacteraceae bacterium]